MLKQWLNKRKEDINDLKSWVNSVIEGQTTPTLIPYTGTPLTDLLPSDCLLHIVLQLNISDLPRIALVCKKFKDVLTSEYLKSAIFFQLYGPDYWGEYVGLHPYKNVPPTFNPFQNLRLSDVQPQVDAILKNDTSDIRTALVRAYEIASVQGWSALLANYKQLSAVWKQNCDSSFLIAGLPNSGKSTVLELIEKRKDFVLIDHYQSFNKFKITRCKFSVVTSSIGFSADAKWTVNMCEVAKPRNWYPHFRNSNESYQYIIYVIDSVAFNASDEYKEELYTEFHGMLGEAKASLFTAIGLIISKTDNPDSAKTKDILKHLKIVPVAVDDYSFNCPFYAGPVTIAVLSVNLLGSTAVTGVSSLVNFLLLQPSSRPHFSVQRTDLIWARLIDSKPSRGLDHPFQYKSFY